ncbi:MAG: response regulator transcription factor [Chloroflexaceae bacterium]|nr:response regulator transcription factor [Chloroflexaceae bacterium]
MYQHKILLVEDDFMLAQALMAVLQDTGYGVTLAQDGTEALDLLETHAFTVVVSDIWIPAANGIDVLQAARQASTPPEVILLTGHGALDTSLTALREGAFDYLLKPCPPEHLLERVEAAIKSYTTRLHQTNAVQHMMEAFQEVLQTDEETDAGVQFDDDPTRGMTTEPDDTVAPTVQVGALCIGPVHYTATFDGQPLHLTPTEHAMLWQMATRPGKVFTYRELVYAMHQCDVSTVEAKILLKTHIRNVRAKIGTDVLVNIRGTGYKFVVPQTTKEDSPSEHKESIIA